MRYSHPARDFSEAPFAVLASDVNRYVLDNGMVVLAKQVYPSQVVFLSLWARVGSAYESGEEAGIAHFVEHMLFKNTRKRAVGQVAQEIHSLGGYLNGFTSYDCTSYWMVLPGSTLPKALEIQFDATFNPLFDQKEVEKERNVIIEEIKMYNDRPADYLSQKLLRAAFTRHNYGRPIIGYEDVLRQINADGLKKFYANHYKPNNCFILAVGDVDPLDVARKCDRVYRKLKDGKVNRSPSPKEPPQKKFRRIDLEGDIKTGHLQMAFHIPSIFDRDIYPLSILGKILGGGESSRLYAGLREKQKIVNEITAYSHPQKEPNLLYVEAELPPANMEKAEEAVFEIVEELAEKGFTDREFQMAKNQSESEYIFSQETVESQGVRIGHAEIMGDYMMVDKFIQRVVDVRKEDALEAAGRYLSRKNCTVGTYRPTKE
jgi:zinc protease